MQKISEKISALVNLDVVNFEFETENASVQDFDLMKIRCYGTHEGINANGVDFNRQILSHSYESFIDKPVIISADKSQMPTGHAYDYKKKKYLSNKRTQIGHIIHAYPVIVKADGTVERVWNDDDVERLDGEYRIVCELVVYKHYFKDIADNLALLHLNHDLKFSMESIVDYVVGEDGIKRCTSIHFTGLAVVQNPAFERAISLMVAEEEEETMDFEQMYNDLKSEHDEIVAQKAVLDAEKETWASEKSTLETELNASKEEAIGLKAELAEANATIEELNTYKEKVESAEKMAVGQERFDKLSKYCEPTKTVEELAELSKNEFVDILAEAVDNYKPVADNGYRGLPNANISTKSNQERLMEILADLK